MSKKYMYIRVSTEHQNTARQEADIETESVDVAFIDRCSGKNFDRPEYQKMKLVLQPDDILILHSIDRLGRNYDMIIEEWQDLARRGVGVKVLDMFLIDTTNKEKSLDGKFLADLVLQILSYVAERERINTKERVRQGVEQAKQRGVYEESAKKRAKTMGYDINWIEFYQFYEQYLIGEINKTQLAKKLKISMPTLNKRIAEYSKNKNI